MLRIERGLQLYYERNPDVPKLRAEDMAMISEFRAIRKVVSMYMSSLRMNKFTGAFRPTLQRPVVKL